MPSIDVALRETAPDDFERRRNHTMYSQASRTRCTTRATEIAFVDHPEFVWSVFVDQAERHPAVDRRRVAVSLDGSSSQL